MSGGTRVQAEGKATTKTVEIWDVDRIGQNISLGLSLSFRFEPSSQQKY